eukprot:CAMPEP_0116971242 /NCGR_PEP_ID=MMETSP0467-20121206/53053_1 /TAXON_ID=283647 /ORGANISM="Mesodinium pulex, Strain SPMC105" /LENGTH=30 /DNA_ID= /DNA_START= /DNA_END= /DNA_ORIENTATION=
MINTTIHSFKLLNSNSKKTILKKSSSDFNN